MRRDVSLPILLLGALATALMVPHATPGQAMAQHARQPAKPSTSLQVTMPDGQLTLSLSDLHAMPQTSVTVHNAHSNRDEQYTGVKVTDLLVKAGARLGKETLHSYLVASGSDGYWVLYSGEEITDLVHTGEVIVAIAEGGQPLAEDGQFKLVSTEDKKPERWVRNLQAIRWQEAKE